MIELKGKDDEISIEINKLLLSLAEAIRLLVWTIDLIRV
jgi:hypothetical protein